MLTKHWLWLVLVVGVVVGIGILDLVNGSLRSERIAVCPETGEIRCRALGVGSFTLTYRIIETPVSRVLSSLCPTEPKQRTWQIGLSRFLDVTDENVARFLETLQREYGCEEARAWLAEIITRSRAARFSSCLVHAGWEATWKPADADAQEWLRTNGDQLRVEWKRVSSR